MNMDYEFMGCLSFVIFISAIAITLGAMVYDQKRQQQEKHKKS